MKLNEIKTNEPKMDVPTMRQQVKDFCDIFDPGNEGVVRCKRFNVYSHGDHTCYYLFHLAPKQKNLFKIWLRKNHFYVSDSYDVHGTGVEWSYAPLPN